VSGFRLSADSARATRPAERKCCLRQPHLARKQSRTAPRTPPPDRFRDQQGDVFLMEDRVVRSFRSTGECRSSANLHVVVLGSAWT